MNAEPTTATVTPLAGGGLTVSVIVPTYELEPATFTLTVERGGDGDWVVSIPWPDTEDSEPVLVNEMDCLNGLLYLGAPEEVTA